MQGAGVLVVRKSIKEVIPKLSEQGFECIVADCGNGFSDVDLDDDYYHARDKMKKFKGARLADVVVPCPETAAKMADESDFSIIMADFDGLSSISKMASMCKNDKVPIFLCTEERYDWSDPTEHSWVDPEWCTYPKEKVYDLNYYIDMIYNRDEETRAIRDAYR